MNKTKEQMIIKIHNLEQDRDKYLDKFAEEETKTSKLYKKIEILEEQININNKKYKNIFEEYNKYKILCTELNKIIKINDKYYLEKCNEYEKKIFKYTSYIYKIINECPLTITDFDNEDEN